VLALFRYRVEAVYNALPGKPAFAVPTTLEQPFYSVFFPAPAGAVFGHAIALEPQDDCDHLAAELVHARIDYAPEHWARVGVLHRQSLDSFMLPVYVPRICVVCAFVPGYQITARNAYERDLARLGGGACRGSCRRSGRRSRGAHSAGHVAACRG
jgi:hypothetical protein